MKNLGYHARSITRNQAGNSSFGYLLLAGLVGVAGISSFTLLGGASELAIADKAAASAVASPLGSFSAAGEGDGIPVGEVPMENGVAPSELGEPTEVGAGQEAARGATEPLGTIDLENGTVVLPDGSVFATIDPQTGELLGEDGSSLGRIDPQSGTIVGSDGATLATIDENLAVYPVVSNADEAAANEAGGIVPGAQVDENGRVQATSDDGGGSGGGFWNKVIGVTALTVGAVAAVALGAPIAVPVALVGLAALGVWDMVRGGGDDSASSTQAPTVDASFSEDDLIRENGQVVVDPETGYAFIQDPETGYIVVVDPNTMEAVTDPNTGEPIMLDPETGERIGSSGATSGETPLDAPNKPGDVVELDALLARYESLLGAPQASEQTETYVYGDSPDSAHMLTVTTLGDEQSGYRIVAQKSTYPPSDEQAEVLFDKSYSSQEFASETVDAELAALYQQAGINFGSTEGGANLLAQDTTSTVFAQNADGSMQQLSLSYLMQGSEDGSGSEVIATIEVVESGAPNESGMAEAQRTRWTLTPQEGDDTLTQFTVVESEAAAFELSMQASN